MINTDIIITTAFRVWSPSELYSETTGTGFVPNPGNLIKNEVTRGFDEVTFVNYTIPSWEVEPYGTTQIFNQDAW